MVEAMDILTVLPWDDDVRGITSGLVDSPPFSWVTEPVRKVRAPVRIRVDAQGGLHLLGNAREIVHLGSDGALLGRTPLPTTSAAIVTDYACDAARECVVLEKGRLVRSDAGGALRWSREVRDDFTKVLLDEGRWRLYLRVKRDGAEVAELDGDTGSDVGVLRLHEQAGPAFVAGGRLGYVFLDEESNTRGISVVHLREGRSTVMPGSAPHYAWLVYPFGMDERSRIYTWRDGRVARITAHDGTIEELDAPDGTVPPHDFWQVDPSGRVVIPVTTPEGLAILRSRSG